jgi:hypothetical protein
MNRTIPKVAMLVAVATSGLLGNPAAAQSSDPAAAPTGCAGDYVCADPSAVPSWPLDRWTLVRRVRRHAAAPQTIDRPPRAVNQ